MKIAIKLNWIMNAHLGVSHMDLLENFINYKRKAIVLITYPHHQLFYFKYHNTDTRKAYHY